jgi:uncharacterized phage-like protein YoqJ
MIDIQNAWIETFEKKVWKESHQINYKSMFLKID